MQVSLSSERRPTCLLPSDELEVSEEMVLNQGSLGGRRKY